MIEIEGTGWYIFLIVATGVILFFNWLFLKESRRIQEKIKGMKSFGDIIDATNQALDEFNTAFDEAGAVIEKQRKELNELIRKAEAAIERLEKVIESSKAKPDSEVLSRDELLLLEADTPAVSPPEKGDRVDAIKKQLALGKSYEEISKMTGASIREVQLVEKFSAGR